MWAICVCVQRLLSNAEAEVKLQQEMCSRLNAELSDVVQKCERQAADFDELNDKLRVMYCILLLLLLDLFGYKLLNQLKRCNIFVVNYRLI